MEQIISWTKGPKNCSMLPVSQMQKWVCRTTYSSDPTNPVKICIPQATFSRLWSYTLCWDHFSQSRGLFRRHKSVKICPARQEKLAVMMSGTHLKQQISRVGRTVLTFCRTLTRKGRDMIVKEELPKLQKYSRNGSAKLARKWRQRKRKTARICSSHCPASPRSWFRWVKDGCLCRPGGFIICRTKWPLGFGGLQQNFLH